MNAGTPTLHLTNGGTPKITGPVYSHDISRIQLDKETTLVEGDVLYPNTACAIPKPALYEPGTLAFQRSAVSVNNLTFDPSVLRGFYCLNYTWDQLFTEPQKDPLLATLAATSTYDPIPDTSGCKVFGPGVYSSPPVLGTNNYFRSGVYRFNNIGLLDLTGKEVLTFGNRAVAGFPAVDNGPCDYARGTDPDKSGATLYIEGDTRFHMKSNPSGVDISGRLINNRPIALHVLNTSLNPNSAGLFETDNGNGRDAAFHGGFWAPKNSLLFETIPSKKAAVLRGGAVIASLRGKVSAAGTDTFLIEVPTTPGVGNLMLDSVATSTNGDGVTTVRTILDYRASSGETATISRRVIW